jgi:hypothetical protein
MNCRIIGKSFWLHQFLLTTKRSSHSGQLIFRVQLIAPNAYLSAAPCFGRGGVSMLKASPPGPWHLSVTESLTLPPSVT